MTVRDIQAQLDASPFIVALGLTCLEMDVDAGTIVMKMPMQPSLERGTGSNQFHGGTIASLIDTVGDFAVVMKTNLSIPTINFRVDFLRPSMGPYVTGHALVRRVGKTVGVVDVDVLDEQGRLTAVGRGCYGVPSSR